jgi:Predicted membrane protein (DUF2232)
LTEEQGLIEGRERGWAGPVLAVLALLLLPATPLLRIVVPVDQTILLLVPAMAVCAIAGWRAGGRLPLAVLWTALAVWMLWQPGNAASPFALLARGWGALLAATFGALVMWSGTDGPLGGRFLSKGLLALGLAMVLGAVVAVIASGSLMAAYEVLSAEIGRRADLSQTQWREMTSTDEWLDLVQGSPGSQAFADEVTRQLAAMPPVGRLLFPALLGLESLAALALAWAVYHRVGRARLGAPLARLRDLRFNDTLVWGVVAGLLVLVLPVPALVRAVGINLLVFFGALYALRGLGVMVWFLAPGRWMGLFLALFTVLFWYVVGVVAVGVGLGDTWFDWRRRTRPKSQRSE